MAAVTPTVTQLFSRWGCVSAAVGVFGAIGVEASIEWMQTQEQTFALLLFAAH